jgi:hypothetical protein
VSDCSTDELTIPLPGAAFAVIEYFPNMMYQFDDNVGASPGCDTVNTAPSKLYWGFPEAVNWSEGPSWKLTVIDLPRAGFAGQPVDTVGLQSEYVWPFVGDVKMSPARAPSVASLKGELMARKLCKVNIRCWLNGRNRMLLP